MSILATLLYDINISVGGVRNVSVLNIVENEHKIGEIISFLFLLTIY